MIRKTEPQAQTQDANGDIGAALLLEKCGKLAWQTVTADTNLGGEVFGGQHLGLAVKAAMLSTPGRTPHALTSFFLHGAQAALPVVYQVECTREGRAFAHRRITASQQGKEVFRAEVSFHEWENNQASHQAIAPAVPGMEELPALHRTVQERADELCSVTVNRVMNRRTFDTHFIDHLEGLGKAGTKPEFSAWVRPNPAPPAGDIVAYYATLAYMSDACANFAARTMHSSNLYDGQMMSASLNHAIWFHAPACSLERVLYAIDSPFSGGGLGVNRGILFNVDGHVLASVVQEALIRRRIDM